MRFAYIFDAIRMVFGCDSHSFWMRFACVWYAIRMRLGCDSHTVLSVPTHGSGILSSLRTAAFTLIHLRGVPHESLGVELLAAIGGGEQAEVFDDRLDPACTHAQIESQRLIIFLERAARGSLQHLYEHEVDAISLGAVSDAQGDDLLVVAGVAVVVEVSFLAHGYGYI